MLQVKVCVGSSCHIRGGAKTLKTIKSLIEAHNMDDQIELTADLCLENCLQAPNVVVDGKTYGGITPDKAEKFFQDYLLAKVNADVGTGDNIN